MQPAEHPGAPTDAHTVITPMGTVLVRFPEEGGSTYEGSDGAIQYLHHIMATHTNGIGATMNPESLEPVELEGFCQPPGAGITVIPPLYDVLDDPEGRDGWDGMTMDDANGVTINETATMREQLARERSPMARLPIMAAILAVHANAQDNSGAPTAPRQRMAALYEFNENRKPAQRKRENVAAMALLAQIDAGDLNPIRLTMEQKQTLAKYSGTGGALIGADGKKGSAYEYYTPAPIVGGVWNVLAEMGFTGGKVLDPCAATGVFGAMAPESAVVEAIELNETSGRINGLVNGGPGYTATVAPFERVAAATPDESYDCVVANVPFGELADRGGNELLDPRYQREPLQNYFVLRSLEKLRPGGIAAFITPPRCVSGKGGKERDLRIKASFMADFLGAYRLPNSVFGTASADTMTDVLFFRKYSAEAATKIAELREQDPAKLVEALVQWEPFIDGDYFKDEGRRFILGEIGRAMGQWGEVDVLTTTATVGEVGAMLRKLPDSRVNWELLEAAETLPVVYRDGDTMVHAGQTLRMEDGRWVPQARGAQEIQGANVLGQLADPYAAFEARVSYDLASASVAHLVATGQALDVPGWAREAIKAIGKLPADDRSKAWSAGVVGMAVQQLQRERGGEDPAVNYAEEYTALSDAMQVQWSTARSLKSKVGGNVKLGLKAILTHYNKRNGFSAVWRGDVLQQVVSEYVTADSSFDGLRYQLKSAWVPLDKAREVLGADFDPMASDDWCLSADGKSVTRAADYYSGNYGDFLRKVDQDIAGAANDDLRGKLLRQKLAAEKFIERVDVSRMDFNLFSPHVTAEEKAEFLRRFVHPNAVVVYDEKTGKARPDIDVKGSDLSDREKLMNRIGDYIKNGTVTLGGVRLSMPDHEALAELRKMVNTANEQFNGWARGNAAIRARLQAVADDPERLRFMTVEDEEALAIPGMNTLDPFTGQPRKLHGYQNAFARKMGREFGGGNGYGVGLGKTFTALASAQYVQSIGAKKKTAFVVPGSVLSKWRVEAIKAYTSIDDCLFIGLREGRGGKMTVNPSAYDEDLNRVLENRHAKVFMTFEAWERLRLRDETIGDFGSYMRRVDASFAESEDKKQDERNKGKQAGTLAVLAEKKGGAPYLEDMGIDSLVTDEAHAFKNASQLSDFKGGKYLSIAKPALRGLDMQAKCWYIRDRNKAATGLDDGVLDLTATPITNSPLEVYTMLAKAVGHERVNDMCMGIKGADQFMHMMCQVDTETDVTMDGIARETNVFTGLRNVNVLRKAIGAVYTIKDAESVGAQVVVPDAEEHATPIALPDEVKERLQLYNQAFRYAIDTMSERSDVRGSAEAYEKVAEHFGEPMNLIGHPFNLISKMTLLIADPELDQRATFFTVSPAQVDLAKKVVADFNKRGITEERHRPGPFTEESAIVGTKVKKSKADDTETTILTVQVRAYLRDQTQIVVDTIDSDSQTAFENMAESAGLDLDVTVPPKLAALLENYQREEASPRGVDDAGNRSKIVKQLIFCDILPLHNKIKRLLNKRAGVPSSAIAVITGRTNNEPEAILAVQDGFNGHGQENRYRCVIGNEKAEVGIDLQKGTQAMHHLTIGWTPDSLTQRNGRGQRQGNKTAFLNIYHYDAEGTFDSSKRVMVNKKADWIDQVMSVDGGDRVAISGGMSNEQLRILIDAVGDADAVRRTEEIMAAKEAERRASTNRDRQLINLDTITKQRAYIQANPDAVNMAIQRILALRTLGQQVSTLRARIANPKATATAIARAEGLLAEVQARMDGLTSVLGSSITITREDYNRDPVPKTVMQFLAEQGVNGTRATKDDDLAEMLRGKKYPVHKIEVIEGGALHTEWTAEIDMAKTMLDEAQKAFERQAVEAGSLPAAVAAAFAQAKGRMVGGKPIVHGAFVRIKDDLGIYDHKDGVLLALRVGVEREARNDIARIKPDSMTIINPGDPAYDDCVTDAAKLEDVENELGRTRSTYSSLVPAVAERRKTAAMVLYDTNTVYELPAPFFPVVIRPSDAQRGPVLARIFSEQSKVISGFEGNQFRVPVTAEVVTVSQPTSRYAAIAQYAKAHGLTAKIGDFSESVYWLSNAFDAVGIPSEESLKTAIASATTSEGVDTAVMQWLTEHAPWFDWSALTVDSGDQAAIKALPYGHAQAIRSSKFAIKRASEQAAAAQVQAGVEKSEGDPLETVGITGDTKPWFGTIKRVAASVGGSKYRWDGKAGVWNVRRSTWDYIVANYPEATKALSMVGATQNLG